MEARSGVEPLFEVLQTACKPNEYGPFRRRLTDSCQIAYTCAVLHNHARKGKQDETQTAHAPCYDP